MNTSVCSLAAVADEDAWMTHLSPVESRRVDLLRRAQSEQGANDAVQCAIGVFRSLAEWRMAEAAIDNEGESAPFSVDGVVAIAKRAFNSPPLIG